MFIDMHVYPAFFEPINEDSVRESMRHEALNIHRNGTAPLEHIFNQMHCAGLDRLCLMPADYTSTLGCAVVENEEIRRLVDMAPDKFIGLPAWIPWLPVRWKIGACVRGSQAEGPEAASGPPAFHA